jgi:nucleoside-diphosphate-sugar epimerase
MRVFVTGASGFLGSAAVRRLAAAGHDVLALSRQPRARAARVEWVVGDLADVRSYQPALENGGAEALLHLAWDALPDYGERTSRLNAVMGEQLLDVAGAAGCAAVVAPGTCWEYGSRVGQLREDVPAAADTPFTRAKARVRAAGDRLAAERGVRFTWVRPFFVYGPGQRGASLVPALLAQAHAGGPIAPRTPEALHDFVFVEDVAEALVALVEASPGGVFNVGSGRPTRVQDVAELVASAAGVAAAAPPHRGEDRAAAPAGAWADVTRVAAAIGWTARTSLRDGIRRTMAATTGDPVGAVR